MKPFQLYYEISLWIFLTYRLIKLEEFCNKVTKVKLCKCLWEAFFKVKLCYRCITLIIFPNRDGAKREASIWINWYQKCGNK